MKSNESLVNIYTNLSLELNALAQECLEPPVAYVYNPLEYAQAMHNQYLRTYGTIPIKVLFLGMNPGPDGMGQTGIPFGAVESVKKYLKLEEPINHPPVEHPKKPVLGMATQKNEPSGNRLWGLFRTRYPNPTDFFSQHLVLNYCPLLFLNNRGANVPTAALKKSLRKKIEDICDQSLKELLSILEPETCVGVGAYATQALNRIVSTQTSQIVQILHPSPASPLANRGWAEQATRALVEAQVWNVL